MQRGQSLVGISASGGRSPPLPSNLLFPVCCVGLLGVVADRQTNRQCPHEQPKPPASELTARISLYATRGSPSFPELTELFYISVLHWTRMHTSPPSSIRKPYIQHLHRSRWESLHGVKRPWTACLYISHANLTPSDSLHQPPPSAAHLFSDRMFPTHCR